jgi:hypothetical protein
MNTQALGESATTRYANGRKHSRIRGMNRSQLTTNRRPGCFSTASINGFRWVTHSQSASRRGLHAGFTQRSPAPSGRSTVSQPPGRFSR